MTSELLINMWNQISWCDAWKILNHTLTHKTCARQIDFKHDVKCKSAFKVLNHITQTNTHTQNSEL